jgi:peptidyl-tRNA hydrolase
MKPAMYLFINRGLGMSPGKIAAQAGHAAVEATLLSHPDLAPPAQEHVRRERLPLWRAWREGLHYAKYVMEARDTEHILLIDRYLNARGFRTHLVIDEGHTEVPPMSATALGVALVDKDDPHTRATFSSFKLYKDERPQDPPKPEGLSFRFTAPNFVWGGSKTPIDLDSASGERRSRRLSGYPAGPKSPDEINGPTA